MRLLEKQFREDMAPPEGSNGTAQSAGLRLEETLQADINSLKNDPKIILSKPADLEEELDEIVPNNQNKKDSEASQKVNTEVINSFELEDVIQEMQKDMKELIDGQKTATKEDSESLWKRKGIKWPHTIAIFLVHLFAVMGAYKFLTLQISLPSLIFMTLHGAICGIGVTGGVHRYYTHKSYRCSKFLQAIHLILYASSGQNTVYQWVRDHRLHHKYSETDADPHNSNRGFFFSHVGWLMVPRHPEFIAKIKSIDMSDILNDPLVKVFDRNFEILRFVLAYALPTAVLMWLGNSFTDAFIFNMLKYAFVLNVIWSVNSAAHIFGYKPYDRRIKPVENWLVSFLALGEGWHNYHHAFPWDYRASGEGYLLNITSFWLDVWASLGQVWDTRQPSQKLVESVRAKYGDSFGHKQH